MAKGLDWDKVRKHGRAYVPLTSERVPRPPTRRAPTAKQLAYVKALRERHGLPPGPRPKTRAEASEDIEHLKVGIPPARERHSDIDAAVKRRIAEQ